MLELWFGSVFKQRVACSRTTWRRDLGSIWRRKKKNYRVNDLGVGYWSFSGKRGILSLRSCRPARQSTPERPEKFADHFVDRVLALGGNRRARAAQWVERPKLKSSRWIQSNGSLTIITRTFNEVLVTLSALSVQALWLRFGFPGSRACRVQQVSLPRHIPCHRFQGTAGFSQPSRPMQPVPRRIHIHPECLGRSAWSRISGHTLSRSARSSLVPPATSRRGTPAP